MAAVLLSIFLQTLLAVSGQKECPRDVDSRVEFCMTETAIVPQAGGGINLVNDVTQTQVICQRGLLQKAADCMDRLYNRCSSDPVEKAKLDNLFSVPSWRKGTQLLCANSAMLVENNSCMKEAAPEVAGCILHLTNTYQQQMRAISHLKNSAVAKELSCSYTGSMMNCLKRPLEETCPGGVASLLVNVMSSFLPPACWPDNRHSDGSLPRNTGNDVDERDEVKVAQIPEDELDKQERDRISIYARDEEEEKEMRPDRWSHEENLMVQNGEDGKQRGSKMSKDQGRNGAISWQYANIHHAIFSSCLFVVLSQRL